jgi:hypothetical protein
MSVEDNFSSYIDEKTGLSVFVDTFDNHEFEVRIGTKDESKSMGTITAENDAELNKNISELVKKYKENS